MLGKRFWCCSNFRKVHQACEIHRATVRATNLSPVRKDPMETYCTVRRRHKSNLLAPLCPKDACILVAVQFGEVST